MTTERIVRWLASLAVAATLALSAATAGLAQTTGPYQPGPAPNKSALKKCIKHAKKKHKRDATAKKKAIKKCRKKFS